MKILKRLHFSLDKNKYFSSRDILFLSLLFIVPIIIDITLALAGHPLLQGDNYNQNFPLRVLAGEQIRQGYLPSWNPYVWSGTPLLAGWNAGALYPGEFLFIIFSPIIAWSLNLALASSIAGVGSYLFIRKLKCGSTASFIGSIAFTYTGFFSGQQVHIGLIEGTAFLPWLLLGIDALATETRYHKRLLWALVIAISSSCSVLSGDPRAITTAAIISVLYVLVYIYRLRNKKDILRFIFYGLIGAILGAGLSAIQWLPGLSFLHSSSRGTSNYSIYSEGSLSLFRIALHLVLPFIKGTAANFGTPTYQGRYNLPEVTIGIGFFALAAALSYLPIALKQLLQFIRFKHKNTQQAIYSRPLGIWYLVGIVGLLLTMGTNTPLGHLFFHVPLFAGERLQNRNAELMDIALAVLLSFFIDDRTVKTLPVITNFDLSIAKAESEPAIGHNDPSAILSTWPKRIMAVIPMICAIAVITFAYIAPLTFEKKISLAVRTPGFFDALDPYLIPTLISAFAIMLYLLFGHKLKKKLQNFIFILLLICDLGIYPAFAGYQTENVSQITANSPTTKAIATVDGPYGRVALFNPTFFSPKNYQMANAELDLPDINIWQNLLSVEGYGSAVNQNYENITNTHQLENLQTSELDSNVFNSLNLKVLISSPISFGEDIPPDSPIPVAGGKPITATGLPGSTANTPSPTPYSGGPVVIKPLANKIFYLPYIHTVKRVTVVVDNPFTNNLVIGVAPGKIIADNVVGNLYSATDSANARSVKEIKSGHTRLRTFTKPISEPVFHHEVHISFTPAKANAIKIIDYSKQPLIIGAVVVVTANPDTRFLADGALEGNMNPKQWGFAGVLDGFSVFINSDNNGTAWLQPLHSISPESRNTIAKVSSSTGSVKILTPEGAVHPTFSVVSKRSQKLILSQAYAPGWTARITSMTNHQTTVMEVKRFDLIDSINIPKGRFIIKMVYAPTSLLAGIVITLGSILILLIIILIIVIERKKLHKLHIKNMNNR